VSRAQSPAREKQLAKLAVASNSTFREFAEHYYREVVVRSRKDPRNLRRYLKALAGDSVWVLPGRGSLEKPLTHNAVNQAMGSITFDIDPFTIHDLRRAGSTLLLKSHLLEQMKSHLLEQIKISQFGGRQGWPFWGLSGLHRLNAL
jgi:hypothetical protein